MKIIPSVLQRLINRQLTVNDAASLGHRVKNPHKTIWTVDRNLLQSRTIPNSANGNPILVDVTVRLLHKSNYYHYFFRSTLTDMSCVRQ